ncbi:D-alanyl-D-alanine carboxypeptidase/D-alanyl-D-alanine endopeptidase [Microlunatus antarcticus]|uniref:D-alanyl-D-alanine carboxypeptidase/D-alanyl-D-alanine-endopeptidase (Penicillin-binding protein 4) n=1 Tax=Microlunatus antarcticus TaxID=53388 RepID=A0A7W5JSA5_9ACTN|nr:D-alanyl-D-alanine carboxypeptidase/D-alanyl-D-alanine-endopeptidase [Microlunatus antarcticus]MBB3325330.1 D-alanyl-D-alanine carboxypeptidase/D-alanyl-D-alanine-endopeptidase (penicillin-binding protein 4) [Microlunatus antarcticus]
MDLKRIVVAVVALLVVAGLVLGAVSGIFASVARQGLEAAGLETPRAPSTLPASALDPSASGTAGATSPAASAAPSTTAPSTAAPSTAGPDGAVALPAPVLAGTEGQGTVSGAALSDRIRGVKVKDSGGYSGEVRDMRTGAVVFSHRAGSGAIPASTTKLVTAAAALDLLGAEHRFTTSVVAAGKGRVVLVGGGDPYLLEKGSSDQPTRASLSTLARRTATALKADGVRKVSLGYDASLFSGPAWNPTWPGSYGDVASRVSALWVNEGRTTPGGGVLGPREGDPAKDAAKAFASQLEKQGIDVGGVSTARAGKDATRLAAVSSMTLERIVEHVLMTSDNDGAEVLLRQAGVAGGRKGSFADGTAVVAARLKDLGAWTSGTRLVDGSGLSRSTRIPAATLTKLLRVAGEESHPQLRPLITGLPVAGVEGSLATRFGDDESLAGRGVVRGKTGTLSKVHGLAGTITTRDGSVLAYAFLVNDPKNDYNATVWLQRVTAAISTCGCR